MFREDFSNQLVIDDSSYDPWLGGEVIVDGFPKAKGLIPRDFGLHPQGCYLSAPPFDPSLMPLIPREEWSERIADMVANQSRLSDIKNNYLGQGRHIPALDQNGQGYCWFYSGTGCVMLLRMACNMPYVRLSGHSGASVIKKFRDQGGWGCAGLDFIQNRGIATVQDWPEQSRSRSHDTEQTWNNAMQYRVTESWMDLNDAAYDRDLTFDQTMTCLLNRIPVIGDFNHMGHSMAVCDGVEVDPNLSLSDPNRWGVRPWNSWGDRFGDRGCFVLRGRKAVPDGGAAPRVAWGG